MLKSSENSTRETLKKRLKPTDSSATLAQTMSYIPSYIRRMKRGLSQKGITCQFRYKRPLPKYPQEKINVVLFKKKKTKKKSLHRTRIEI